MPVINSKDSPQLTQQGSVVADTTLQRQQSTSDQRRPPGVVASEAITGTAATVAEDKHRPASRRSQEQVAYSPDINGQSHIINKHPGNFAQSVTVEESDTAQGLRRNTAESMNQTQAYMEVHPSHMPSAQPYHPHGPPSGPLGPYGQHYHSAALLPTGSTYGPSADSYPSYNGYGGMTSPPATSHSVPPPMTSQVGSQILPIPGE